MTAPKVNEDKPSAAGISRTADPSRGRQATIVRRFVTFQSNISESYVVSYCRPSTSMFEACGSTRTQCMCLESRKQLPFGVAASQ